MTDMEWRMKWAHLWEGSGRRGEALAELMAEHCKALKANESMVEEEVKCNDVPSSSGNSLLTLSLWLSFPLLNLPTTCPQSPFLNTGTFLGMDFLGVIMRIVMMSPLVPRLELEPISACN
ncbi:hypothetical protein C8J56DRAFT_896393 [Mycena floridula]|nr:hypothetical protein C8J56DRAFT_896393 [Mycena floridula]